MKRLGRGLMRLDFQAQARLFQCAVTPDVINPLVGQDDVFPFGCLTLGLWDNMLHGTFVGLENPLRVSATVIVAFPKMPQGQTGALLIINQTVLFTLWKQKSPGSDLHREGRFVGPERSCYVTRAEKRSKVAES